jgi:hypothetical protein
MWKKCVRWTTRTGGVRWTKFIIFWAYCTAHASLFYCKICLWGAVIQGLYPVCWRSTRNYVAFVCTGTSRIRPKGQKHILTVLTAEGRLVYVVVRERRSNRLFGRASNILCQKKARQASSCLKNVSSQGVPSSRRMFDSAALHSGPKAFVGGVKTTPKQVAASARDYAPPHTAV